MLVKVFYNGGESGFLVSNELLTIGRSVFNDVITLDSLTSKFHAEILDCEYGLRVIDLNSKNGSVLILPNNSKKKLEPTKKYNFTYACKLLLGDSVLSFENSSSFDSPVRHNLELMAGLFSRRAGGLIYLAKDESAGGNADYWTSPHNREFACIATNFHFNPDDGRICGFTNDSKQFRSNNSVSGGIFRLISESYKHVETLYWTKSSKLAQENLCKSAELYNKIIDSKLPVFNFTFLNGERKSESLFFHQNSFTIGNCDNMDICLSESDFPDWHFTLGYVNETFMIISCEDYSQSYIKRGFWPKRHYSKFKSVKDNDILLIGKSKLKFNLKHPTPLSAEDFI